MIFSVAPESVTVVTPAVAVDPLDPSPPPPSPATETQRSAVILPQGGTEITENGTRIQALTTYRAWFIGHIPIQPSSRIRRSSGIELEVVGQPEYWPPMGDVGHTEVIAVLVVG